MATATINPAMMNGATGALWNKMPATKTPITIPIEKALVRRDETRPVSLRGVMSPVTATNNV